MAVFDRGETPAGRRMTTAYLTAVPGTVVAMAARVALDDLFGERARVMTLFLPITLAASLGGFRPGFLATLCGTVLTYGVFVAPRRGTGSATLGDVTSLVLFAVVGAAISAICERMHRSTERLATAERAHAAASAEAARALRESEERVRRKLAQLRATYATAPVGLCVIDPELRFVRLNDRLAELNGLPAEAHIGKTVREVLPDLADQAEPMFRRILEVGEPALNVEIEGETPAQPGVKRTWRESFYPLRDESGAMLGINVVCEEITECKRHAEALRAATEAAERSVTRLEAVLASIHEGLLITAEDGAVVTINAPGLRICGLDSLEGGRALAAEFEMSTLDGAPVPRDAWPARRIGRGEHVERIELRVRRRDTGQEQFVAYAGGPVRDREGRRIGGVLTFQDVTAEKRAAMEREMLLVSERAARADAERANRMKDEFLAVVSHELRTPLNAVLGWASLLRRPIRTPDQIDKGLAVVDRNTRILVQLISDLLDVSRIVSGKLHVDLQLVAIDAAVEGAVDALRTMAAAKGVNLTAAITPVGASAWGDSSRIQQIVTNLLSNAIKFTPAGGHASVSVELCDGRVEIRVRDSGQGIAPEFLPHVFDRFRQADSSRTRQHGGLGLGLAIVKHLVELHDGTVRAESAGLGQGASFTVSIPCDAARLSLEAPPASFDEPTSLRGIRVLVVDDEHDSRELVGRVLEEHAATVTAAASTDEALAVLRSGAIDVVVSDIGMPGKDGYALIHAIRSGNVGAGARSRVPALALTAFARAEDRTRALQAGFQGHMTKPIEPAELVGGVARMAAMSAAAAAAE